MPTWRPPLPARWRGATPPTFVGRGRELAAPDQVWAAVTAGTRQVVLVGGEAGAGKSRLVAEVAPRHDVGSALGAPGRRERANCSAATEGQVR